MVVIVIIFIVITTMIKIKNFSEEVLSMTTPQRVIYNCQSIPLPESIRCTLAVLCINKLPELRDILHPDLERFGIAKVIGLFAPKAYPGEIEIAEAKVSKKRKATPHILLAQVKGNQWVAHPIGKTPRIEDLTLATVEDDAEHRKEGPNPLLAMIAAVAQFQAELHASKMEQRRFDSTKALKLCTKAPDHVQREKGKNALLYYTTIDKEDVKHTLVPCLLKKFIKQLKRV